MSIVVKARRTDEGIVIHEMDNGESKKFLAVRGGISWPVMDGPLPAYYCILGEEYVGITHFEGQEPQRGKLILLSENEAPDVLALDWLYAKISDDVVRFGCDTFYTVTKELRGEDYSGYVETFQEFMVEKEVRVHLEEAPWADKPDLGMYHIDSWKKKGLLDLPEESLVCKQLEMVTADIVNQLPQRLPAVNALRFVACGFQKDRPNPGAKNWRAKLPKGAPSRHLSHIR
jgi:hypothetical protein